MFNNCALLSRGLSLLQPFIRMHISDLPPRMAGVARPSVTLTSDTRLYAIDTPLGPDMLMVERFVGKEELSSLYEYHVDCLSTDAHIERKKLLGQQVVLRIRLFDGSLGRRSGYVSAVAQLGSDGGLARYRLKIVPWLAFAAYQRRSRVFQDVGILELDTSYGGKTTAR